MKFLLSAIVPAMASTVPDHPLAVQFVEFMQKYNKKYDSEEEINYRIKTFEHNLKLIEEENRKGHKHTVGVNQFADMEFEEFSRKYARTGVARPKKDKSVPRKKQVYNPNDVTEDAIDWVEQGAVTAVKDQGQCGSCWAFSSTGALEGAWQIMTGELVSFSEQQFVDCATAEYGNYGCNGGFYTGAFEYLKTHGMCHEEDYTYTAEDDACSYDKCKDNLAMPVGSVAYYTDIDATEAGLRAALQNGPVSVAIEADTWVFQFYSGGVLVNDQCGTQLDHAVLAVGYGELDGVKFWKVKNSWGPSWGKEGYILLGRGVNPSGECGILLATDQPTLQEVKKTAPKMLVA